MQIAPDAISTSPQSSSRDLSPRTFRLLLLVITLLGAAIRIYVGAKNFLSFDEWQHLFMASSPRWADLSFELRTNAHPPLFFLLLGAMLKLGIPAFYRFISIASGVGSIVVVGLIARRLLESIWMQLLCAAAFALSFDAITTSVEIRSYQLTVFLVLLAFLAWLAMLEPAPGRSVVRPAIAFALCCSLAVTSHYSAVFFLGAALTVLLFTLRDRSIPRASILAISAAFAVPLGIFAVEYFVHASVQIIQGYLYPYYLGRTPNESSVAFAAKNSLNFFNLFSPFGLHSELALFLLVLPLGAAATFISFSRLRTRPDTGLKSRAVILVPIVIVAEMFVSSLIGEYPFGGMLRHQYIAGPFLLIAAFVVLDALISQLSPIRRVAMPALLMLVSVGNLIYTWPSLILLPGFVILNREFTEWKSAFPNLKAVYLDHWSVIGYFMHTSEGQRSFVRRIRDKAVIDEFHISGGTANGMEIFYDKSRILADPLEPTVYRSLAACLRKSGVKELGLFYFNPSEKKFDLTPDQLRDTITELADDQGMNTSDVYIGPTYLFVAFSLQAADGH